MDFQHGDRSRDVLQRVRAFLRTHVEPVESRYWSEVHAENPGGDWRAWRIHPLLEELKARARAEGLWNLFLPDAEQGGGLSPLEYAPIAEETGRSFLAPEVASSGLFVASNCSDLPSG